MSASVELRDVSVDGILYDVNLTIAADETVALIGRSGAGKTTALRTMNGLVRPSGGEVFVDGTALASTDLIALRRHTGYIIQGVGLFPHRSVYDNVATVPRLLGWPEERIRAAASDMMRDIGIPLERFGTRRPSLLSGGEQQRVGIARAMIAGPALLLCDEPFGALDPIVRRELQDVFIAMRSGVTIVFVTHDLGEALRVCERVVLLDAGRIVSDTPALNFTSEPEPLAQQFVAAARL
ncbi:MAG TPA: ATP-binding cassette domain-containing protein [Thermoanaerobaculia bacterium]